MTDNPLFWNLRIFSLDQSRHSLKLRLRWFGIIVIIIKDNGDALTIHFPFPRLPAYFIVFKKPFDSAISTNDPVIRPKDLNAVPEMTGVDRFMQYILVRI